MYQYFHKLRVRFAELEMKQGECCQGAGHSYRPDRCILLR